MIGPEPVLSRKGYLIVPSPIEAATRSPRYPSNFSGISRDYPSWGSCLIVLVSAFMPYRDLQLRTIVVYEMSALLVVMGIPYSTASSLVDCPRVSASSDRLCQALNRFAMHCEYRHHDLSSLWVTVQSDEAEAKLGLPRTNWPGSRTFSGR